MQVHTKHILKTLGTTKTQHYTNTLVLGLFADSCQSPWWCGFLSDAWPQTLVMCAGHTFPSQTNRCQPRQLSNEKLPKVWGGLRSFTTSSRYASACCTRAWTPEDDNHLRDFQRRLKPAQISSEQETDGSVVHSLCYDDARPPWVLMGKMDADRRAQTEINRSH